MRILITAVLIILVLTTSLVLIKNLNEEKVTNHLVEKGAHEEKVIDLLIETEITEITRGTGDAYTTPITIKGKDIYTIGSKTWLTTDERLPITLQLISPQGEVAVTLTSREKGITTFTLVANTFCHKDGYTLKVKDQLNRLLIKSRLIILPCKGVVL